ncbi:MAG: hypothetical protein Hyperionvirus24_2 [Hyperionvirus sp.]|uniref:Uncharacterized protein n=1 Tax=Hyperionvirus sp. TaxID=2487770 RepID=A0A3G5AAX4_9VIRU|nr:MAG: hypothetical protein Hyperionvirus24_2 [Hyperionvirus sp.]
MDAIPFQILTGFLTIEDLVSLSQCDVYFKKRIYENISVSVHLAAEKFFEYGAIVDTFKKSTVKLSGSKYMTFSQYAENIVELIWDRSRFLEDSGVELLVNLRKLTIKSESCLNGSGITKLSRLTSLCQCYYGNIYEVFEDLQLGDWKELKELEVDGRCIHDSGVGMLTNLTKLVVNYSELSYESLSKLVKLEVLSLDGNHLLKDHELCRLTNLTSLSLFWDDVVTAAGVRDLTNLVSLSLHYVDGISDFGEMGLLALEELGFDGDAVSYDSVKYLTNLTKLELNYNESFTDNDLSKMNLRSLGLCNRSLVTDHCLGKLTGLTCLNLRGNREISDDGIRALVGLKIFNGNGSKITKDALLGLPSLREIYGDSYLEDEKLFIDKGVVIRDRLSRFERFREVTRAYSNKY